jgi:hypothetical protein
MDFPLKGWPASIISVLKREVADFIEDPEIKWFYIGRTNNLAASKSRHGSDDILSLYETDSAENAMDVEDVLIKKFHNHPKCNNDAKHSGGGATDGFINYVYIAIWTEKAEG